jgi:hypothetical protein
MTGTKSYLLGQNYNHDACELYLLDQIICHWDRVLI